MIMRNTLAAACLVLAVSAQASAARTPASPPSAENAPAAEASRHTPADIFRDSIYDLQKFLDSRQARNPAAIKAYVMKNVRPLFDMQHMAMLAAGRYYKRMTPEQRETFVGRLEENFFKQFTRQLVNRSGQQPRIQFLKMRRNQSDKRVDVLSRVSYPNNRSQRVVLRFADTPLGWRVYDVSADGHSAALYFRQYFSRQAKRGRGPERLLQ